MIIKGVDKYFRAVLHAHNAQIEDTLKRLNKSEIKFLVDSALYHYDGGDLKDLNSLYEALLGDSVKSKNHFAVLRSNIAAKKFIMTSRKELVLPKELKKRRGDVLKTSIFYVD